MAPSVALPDLSEEMLVYEVADVAGSVADKRDGLAARTR
jgi:hypothetical protein